MVLNFAFESLVHIEHIFGMGERYMSRHFLFLLSFPSGVQLFGDHLLTGLPFLCFVHYEIPVD